MDSTSLTGEFHGFMSHHEILESTMIRFHMRWDIYKRNLKDSQTGERSQFWHVVQKMIINN